MQRKHMVVGATIAIAMLLPLGQWVIAFRQQAAAYKEDLKVEQQFVAGRKAAGLQMAAAPGQWGGRQSGGQRGGGPGRAGSGQRGQGRQRMMAQMVKEVELTEAQVKQIQAVRDSSRPMMSDVFRNPQFTREQKRTAMQQIRQAQQEQIGRFLTTDQQAKYAAFQAKMRQQRQARRAVGGFDGSAGSGSVLGGPASGNDTQNGQGVGGNN